MSTKRENIEFIDQEQERKEIKSFSLKGILDGSVLAKTAITNQLPFIFFLVLLGLLYIGNRYRAERLVRQMDHIQTEVGNLRAEQITTASELMKISTPSEVAKLIQEKNLGLEEATKPPVKIVKKDD